MNLAPILPPTAKVKLIRGAIVLSWEKYGVHILDAVLGMPTARPDCGADALRRSRLGRYSV